MGYARCYTATYPAACVGSAAAHAARRQSQEHVRTLDGLAFSAEEEAAVEKGAIDAFVRFTVLLEQAYATAPELA